MAFKEKATLFLFFFILFCFFSSFKTTVQIPDEEYILRVAQNISEGKPLHLPDAYPYVHPGVTERGSDGKKYSTYPIGQSLIYAPFYFVFKNLNIFFSPFKGPDTKEARIKWLNKVEFETTRYLYIVPALFTALSCLILYILCFSLGFKRITCLLSVLTFSFATIAWPYSKLLLTESVQGFLLLATVYAFFNLSRSSELRPFQVVLAAVCFGALCIVKPTFLILAPFLGFYWLYKKLNLKNALIAVSIFAVFFLLIFSLQIVYNLIRFSDTTNFGYSQAKFTAPFYVGLYGMLLSSGKSFFLYSPVTLLFLFSIKEFYKRHGREALLFVSIIVSMISVYSSWNVWSGDYSWGPRFLVPIAPFFMIPACIVIERAIYSRGILLRFSLGILLAVSIWVQIPAVGVHFLTYLNYFKMYVAPIPAANMSVNFRGKYGKLGLRDSNQDFQFIPEFSPILGQWWVFKNTLFKSEKAFSNTPWKGLGYNKFHKGIPLHLELDLWTLNLIRDSLEKGKLSNLFWIIIMIFLIPLSFAAYFFDSKVAGNLSESLEYRRKPD